MRRLLLLTAVTASVLVLGGCSSDPVTKAQFVDHAVKISNPDSAKAEAALRRVFGCAWTEVSKDESLVDDFMAAETSDEQISAAISPYLGKCAVRSSP